MNAFKIQYYSRKFFDRFIKRLPGLKRAYLNSFPAIHIKPLDWYDYILRFSSELLILFLALGVASMNLFNFYATETYADKSFAAKFLSYHTELNPKLYKKNSVIITKIVSSRGLVPLAEASDFTTLGADASNTKEDVSATEEQSFTAAVLVQPNPDTLESLVAKQIKVYKTENRDTLASIAKANSISVETLMWANNLTNENIRPGWFLVILPTDGVLHKATSNDTLPDIAKKYGGSLEIIISYNGLESAEDIDADQLIIVPDGKIPQSPKPKPATANSDKVNSGGVSQPKIINNGTGHLFPWGYCTWYVASKVNVPWGGNAKNWLTNAKAYGAVISNTPAIGAIVVTTDNKRYGHVAYIESVDERGFTVSEMNYEKFGRVNTRWINKNSPTIRGYIYP